jgi:hypothetical protein
MRLRLPTFVPAIVATAVLGAGAFAAAHSVDNRPAPKVVISSVPASDDQPSHSGQDLIDHDGPIASASHDVVDNDNDNDDRGPSSTPSPSPRPSTRPRPSASGDHDANDNDNDNDGANHNDGVNDNDGGQHGDVNHGNQGSGDGHAHGDGEPRDG